MKIDHDFPEDKFFMKIKDLAQTIGGLIVSIPLAMSKNGWFKVAGWFLLVTMSIIIALWIFYLIRHNIKFNKDRNYKIPLLLPSLQYDAKESGSSGKLENGKNIRIHTIRFINIGSTFEIIEKPKMDGVIIRFHPERFIPKDKMATIFIEHPAEFNKKDISFKLNIKDENGKSGNVLCVYHDGQNHISFARI